MRNNSSANLPGAAESRDICGLWSRSHVVNARRSTVARKDRAWSSIKMASGILGELTKYYPTEDADTKNIRTEFPREGLVRWLSVYVIGVMGAGMTFGTLYLGDNVACQPFPRDYGGYGFATSIYDTAYCANHIEAYDNHFRNGTHTFEYTPEKRTEICETAQPSRLWQNIIPSIFLLMAFVNYIPSFLASTFLRDRILSYLLFIKHSIDQGCGDLNRIMRFATSRVDGEATEEEEDMPYRDLGKQCLKWQGTGLSRAYFGMCLLRLFLLIGEVLVFCIWERVRFDQIRQDFICCVDRQEPVMCTFSKYYTLLFIWVVAIAAIAVSAIITIKGILFIFAEMSCNCKLCQNHTLKVCRCCTKSWCDRHDDGCQQCGKCRCMSDCKSHVYSRISGSPLPCCLEEPETVDSSVPPSVDVKGRGQKLKTQNSPKGGKSCYPMDHQFISHLCYANSHAMKLLMIVNVMETLAESSSGKPNKMPGSQNAGRGLKLAKGLVRRSKDPV